MTKLNVYIAGPDVFKVDENQTRDRLVGVITGLGHTPLWPGDNEVNNGARGIYLHNLKLLNSADVVIANVTPFRGPSMDVGTAFELGYAVANNVPVVVYMTQDHGVDYKRRVTDFFGFSKTRTVDDQNNHIENFRLFENLMIACGVDIERVGGPYPSFEAAAGILRYFKPREKKDDNAGDVCVSKVKRSVLGTTATGRTVTLTMPIDGPVVGNLTFR